MKYVSLLFFLSVVSAVLFLLAGCAKESADEASAPPAVQKETFSTTFDELLNKKSAARCTWTATDAEGKAEGIILIKGEKYTQETHVTAPDGTTTRSTLLFDGQCVHIWEDGTVTGMKMCPPAGAAAESSASPEGRPAGSIQCTGQDVHDSAFVPPEHVTFTETKLG